jgi:serine/threonine protein kinase/TPR repeat protein
LEPKKTNDPDELGGWRINGRLGEGGFGTVFLAEKGAQKAAIKVIRQEFVQEEDARNRLAIEAEVLSKLSDPSIGKILDSDLSGEFPWIATEFINGPTLEDKIKYEGPLEEIAWFNLAANIFHAIVSANELGIIHKDIKPSNIILGETGNKLIDFGIAHITGQTRTAVFGDREGSTPFSSPEHFTIKTNPKMDVFSAAATLAYAAKGRSVWNGDNDLQLMRSINEDEPSFDGITENQEKFLRPLLEKNPSDRPSAHDAHLSSLNYIEFLLGKRKKPPKLKGRSFTGRTLLKKNSYLLPVIPISLLFLIIGIGYTVNNQESELLRQCSTNLREGSLDSAVESCVKSVAEGDAGSQVLLARAHMAKGSESQAKLVLQNCRFEDVACESDYAYFFETGEQAINSLKKSYVKGDSEAAWRIGISYQRQDKIQSALEWYEKGAKDNSAISNLLLSTYWGSEKKQYKKALVFAKRAVDGDLTGRPTLLQLDHPVERLIESLYSSANDIPGKIEYFTSCANQKVAFCVSTLANTFLASKDYENAKKWGLVGADLQDAKSMWVLARVGAYKNSLLPKGTVDEEIDKEIIGWYKKSAELGDARSSLGLAFAYSFGMGSLKSDWKESCSWLQKTMIALTERKGTYEEVSSDVDDYAQAAQFFQLQNCQNILLGDTPSLANSLSSSSPKASAKPSSSATPNVTSSKTELPLSQSPPATAKISDGNLSPLLAYNSSEYSEKVTVDVKTTSIFGRAYSNGFDWIIPLTNSANESVPPVNRVQFRDSALPFGSWWNMPYKLVDGGNVGWHAVVSNIGIQIGHSTGKKVCPEFRLALVQNGLVTYIWTKSVEPCTVS